jgi:hypothetical protein
MWSGGIPQDGRCGLPTGNPASLAHSVCSLPPETSTDGQADDHRILLCLINRDEIPVSFLLPAGVWWQVCDSSAPSPFAACQRERTSTLPARSVQILGLQ